MSQIIGDDPEFFFLDLLTFVLGFVHVNMGTLWSSAWTKRPTELDQAIAHFDGAGVLNQLRLHSSALVENERGHEWMQRHFTSLSTDAQSGYVDLLIRGVRFDLVPHATGVQWRAWLLRPGNKFAMSRRQITDLHVMIAHSPDENCFWRCLQYRT